METRTYIAFSGTRRIASGPLSDLLPALKRRFDRDPTAPLLVFDDATGRQVDFDLGGTLDQVLERELPPVSRGPGRPRLGVTSREITLLPRHWEWLDEQPNGASPALRRLVEQAMQSQSGPERARKVRAALSAFLTAMAGDRPGYEEACRALFAGDTARFDALVSRWPKDIREYASARAAEAARLQAQPPAEVPARPGLAV